MNLNDISTEAEMAIYWSRKYDFVTYAPTSMYENDKDYLRLSEPSMVHFTLFTDDALEKEIAKRELAEKQEKLEAAKAVIEALS